MIYQKISLLGFLIYQIGVCMVYADGLQDVENRKTVVTFQEPVGFSAYLADMQEGKIFNGVGSWAPMHKADAIVFFSQDSTEIDLLPDFGREIYGASKDEEKKPYHFIEFSTSFKEDAIALFVFYDYAGEITEKEIMTNTAQIILNYFTDMPLNFNLIK